jgi:hypothetical protein
MTISEDALNQVKTELARFGDPDAKGVYLTIIEEAAIRASLPSAPENLQKHKDILDELNRLRRKFKRSAVAEEKIRKELSTLSDLAQTFVQFELAAHQHQRSSNLSLEDWSDPALQKALKQSVSDARRWVRQSPGGRTASRAHAFCRDVMLVYQQISGKPPGVGGDAYGKYYMTPFERLWHASLLLIDPSATIFKAREIFRRATFRKRRRKTLPPLLAG